MVRVDIDQSVDRPGDLLDPEQLIRMELVRFGFDDTADRDFAVMLRRDRQLHLQRVAAVALFGNDAARRFRQGSEPVGCICRQCGQRFGVIHQSWNHIRHHLGVSSISMSSPTVIVFVPGFSFGKSPVVSARSPFLFVLPS